MFRNHGTKCKIMQITRGASGILQGFAEGFESNRIESASLTQCNLDCNCDNLTSLTQWNIAKLNFLMKFVPEQALFHVKILGTSLEHGSGTPK